MIIFKWEVAWFFSKGGGSTNERPETDHVISGPMTGLKKTAPNGADGHTDRQTDGHGDSMKIYHNFLINVMI